LDNEGFGSRLSTGIGDDVEKLRRQMSSGRIHDGRTAARSKTETENKRRHQEKKGATGTVIKWVGAENETAAFESRSKSWTGTRDGFSTGNSIPRKKRRCPERGIGTRPRESKSNNLNKRRRESESRRKLGEKSVTNGRQNAVPPPIARIGDLRSRRSESRAQSSSSMTEITRVEKKTCKAGEG